MLWVGMIIDRFANTHQAPAVDVLVAIELCIWVLLHEMANLQMEESVDLGFGEECPGIFGIRSLKDNVHIYASLGNRSKVPAISQIPSALKCYS